MNNSDDKTLAMLMWILAIFFPWLSPIIFMLVAREKELVYRNTMQCLTFQIVLTILYLLIWVVGLFTCGAGLILLVIPGILHIIMPVMGAVAASSGGVYEPPVSSKLARSWFGV